MKMKSLQDALVAQLKDLYSAENQLIKALPKMAKAVSNDELKAGFEKHLEETRGQVERIEKICGVPIDVVSTGPERDETIVRRQPFD